MQLTDLLESRAKCLLPRLFHTESLEAMIITKMFKSCVFTGIGKAVIQHTYGGTWGEMMYSSYSFTNLRVP